MSRLLGLGRRLASVLFLAVAVAGVVVLLRDGGEDKTLVANFTRAVGLYEGSEMRVLGVPVGTVTRIEPVGTAVKVTMTYPAEVKLPANAKAVVVAPTVVADRYVQITPVYTGGEVLADDADLPMERTEVPVELDEIFRSLDRLNVALGPNGANRDGAVSRLVRTTANNLGNGNGERLNQAFEDLSKLVGTLSDNRDDLFATITNLSEFTATLARSDAEVEAFNRDLATVSEQLAAEREELQAALRNLSVALTQVAGFVRDNRAALREDLDGLAEVTGTLLKQKDALQEYLDIAPLGLQNLNQAYNPETETLDTRNNDEGSDPRGNLCQLLTGSGLGQLCAVVPSGQPASRGAPSFETVDPTLGGILRGSR